MAKKKPDKDKPILNGFTEKELIKLYTFIAQIESIIEKYDTSKHKAGFNAIIPDRQINTLKKDDVVGHINDPLSNEIYLSDKGNKPISFTVHLRNSIAHGLIHANGDEVTIKDIEIVPQKNNIKKQILTAIGKFDKEKIFKVIEYMHSIK